MFAAGLASAQQMTGSVTAEQISSTFGGFSEATSSSMQIWWTNVVQTASGSFSGIVLQNSLMNASGEQITGLSSTPISTPVNLFLQFSVANDFTYGSTTPGTTPSNRFDFNLLTLAETSYDSDTGAATFIGTGTIVDITGALQSTPGELTVDFSSANDYTLTLEAVPEPATIGLVSAGFLGLLVLRHRKA